MKTIVSALLRFQVIAGVAGTASALSTPRPSSNRSTAITIELASICDAQRARKRWRASLPAAEMRVLRYR